MTNIPAYNCNTWAAFELTGSQGVGQIQPNWKMEESFEFDLRQSSLKVTQEQTRHQMQILTCTQFML